MVNLRLKIPPLAVFLLTGALIWLADNLTPGLRIALRERKPIAIALAVAAVLLAAQGILQFLRARTTIWPHAPEKAAKLVTTGAYAVSRNPMYLSLLLLLLAWCTLLANPVTLLPLPAFVMFLNVFQIRPEEEALARIFGREFSEYCDRVRRWL